MTGTGSKKAVPEPLIRVGDDFEDEFPGASALATECFANLWRAADLLTQLHNRHSHDAYRLSPGAREVLAVLEGAGEPLEPSVIAERLLVTTGSMTSVLDTLEKRDLIRRLPHPNDRRKLLVDITPQRRQSWTSFFPRCTHASATSSPPRSPPPSNANSSSSSPNSNKQRSTHARSRRQVMPAAFAVRSKKGT